MARGLTMDRLDPTACRRLVAGVLLQACLDAHHGNGAALAWLYSEIAAQWAALLELEHWPPCPGQLGTRAQLKQRANGGCK